MQQIGGQGELILVISSWDAEVVWSSKYTRVRNSLPGLGIWQFNITSVWPSCTDIRELVAASATPAHRPHQAYQDKATRQIWTAPICLLLRPLALLGMPIVAQLGLLYWHDVMRIWLDLQGKHCQKWVTQLIFAFTISHSNMTLTILC